MSHYSPTKTVALRELHEGAPPTFERLGAAAGRSAASIERKAKREGWADGFAPGNDGERLARLAALRDWIINRLETVRFKAENGNEPIDKAEVEAASVLMRTVEKLGDVSRALELAPEAQLLRDARKAGVLRRIDARIIELAQEFARQLAA